MADKFLKLRKIYFYVKFSGAFYFFFENNCQNCNFIWPTEYFLIIASIWGFSWNFLISLDSRSYVFQQLRRELLHLLSDENNLVPYHFWSKTQVYKYPVQGSKRMVSLKRCLRYVYVNIFSLVCSLLIIQ